MCFTGSCGDDSLQILVMVIRRHVVLMTAYAVSKAVISHINHNVKICSADRFLDVTFTFTSSETWAFAVYKERFLCIALRDDGGFLGCYKFFTEFNQLFVNLLGQLAASGKCSDSDRGNRHRLLQQFYVWHNIPPKCMS